MSIIFESIAGSRLFGTDTSLSDTDIKKIVLPSIDDLLLGNIDFFSERHSPPSADKSLDVEITEMSLKHYFNMLNSGEIFPIEILFTPDSHIIQSSDVWDTLVENKDVLFSHGLHKFYNFSKATLKTYKKGSNRLNTLKEILSRINLEGTIKDFNSVGMQCIVKQDNHIEFSGKKYRYNMSQRILYDNVLKEINKYSERMISDSLKRESVVLSHCARIIDEAREYMGTGHMEFPRHNAEFLLAIKQGHIEHDKAEEYIIRGLQDVEHLMSTRSYYGSDIKYSPKMYENMLKEAHYDILNSFIKQTPNNLRLFAGNFS